ncbi:unnamed protein product [Coffea canephora]|uniref:Secreted protein n=1 Tax=Coffea canephora TaxID=49390 RepID=A0A068VK85_COFCA|nr:unnamed protein product [Coffea canephora]
MCLCLLLIWLSRKLSRPVRIALPQRLLPLAATAKTLSAVSRTALPPETGDEGAGRTLDSSSTSFVA